MWNALGLLDESAIHRNITPHVILAPKRTKLRERKTPSSFGKRLLGLPCFMGLDLEVGSKLNPQPFLGTGASEFYCIFLITRGSGCHDPGPVPTTRSFARGACFENQLKSY